MKHIILLISIILLTHSWLTAQERQFPIVEKYGGIFEIEDAVEVLDPNEKVKVIIELVSGHSTSEEFSFWVNNIARLMNLHGVQGVTKENLEVKVIVHGPAVYDILIDKNYAEKYAVDFNPNLPILEAVNAGGAEIIVCGQSLIARDLTQKDLWGNTKVATSALTTITKNVADGYVLIKF